MADMLSAKVIGKVLAYEQDCVFDTETNKYIPVGEKHIKIKKTNAVHPQNMARIIARALANEPNFFISRVAFGNGGTVIDVAKNITFNAPRDGLNVGDDTWKARLYNETYSEIVDDNSINIGYGSGASPADDPISVPNQSGPGVRSIEDTTLGSTVSSVVITVVLNPNEPFGQAENQTSDTNTESNFTFDEIGLYTAGAPPDHTAGSQSVIVGGKRNYDNTGLLPNHTYNFQITRDGGTSQVVSVTTPLSGTGGTGLGSNAPIGAILYKDLIDILNLPSGQLFAAGAVASITNGIPTQDGGIETFGMLKFTSLTTGSASTILLVDGVSNGLFAGLTGYAGLQNPIAGTNAGIRNNPSNPTQERERLLTHLCFSPVNKSKDRIFTISYTLDIVVARSV
jgi:hypothetical protein